MLHCLVAHTWLETPKPIDVLVLFHLTLFQCFGRYACKSLSKLYIFADEHVYIFKVIQTFD